MNTSDLSRVLDEISQEHVPPDVNLLPRVIVKIGKEKISIMKPHIKLAPAILMVAAAFVLVVLAVPGAATAMRRVFGFIPGIGLVEQNANLRVLAEPVSENRDGFALTVENAVIDSEHTVITYSVEGPFASGAFQSENTLSDICFSAAELRLPDGKVYQTPGGFPDETWDTGYRVKYTYDPIPADVENAVLVLPCVHAMPLGQGPQNWEAPLNFVPAPADMTVYPVGGENTQPAEKPFGTDADPALGIEMYLDSVIPMTDGQLVQVRVDWQDNPNITWVNLNAEDVKILDSNAQEIAFEPSSEAVNPGENDSTSTAFGFKTTGMDSSGQAQLIVNAASEVMMKSSASFTFDPAAEGANDRVWEMNKELNLDGQELRIEKITLDEIGGNASLTINMESSGDIISAGVTDQAHPSISGADGRSGDISDGVNTYHKFWVTLNYDGGLPEEPITFTIFSYTIRLDEKPWVIEWTPAAAPANTDAAGDQSQAECLSRSAWQESMQSTPSIPDELNGRMLLELTLDDGRLNNQLAVSRLDGSEMKFLAEGSANGAVSPDGTRMVYTDSKGGIQMYTFETGISEPLAGGGSFTGVERLFWSPDGTQIAFSGTDNNAPMNIYVSTLDGSNPRMIESGEPLKLMQGWLPDGRMLYVTMDKNGPVLKLIDPQNGETSALFNVPQLATQVEVSKDGKRLAINWLEEATGERSLYVFTADGSQRRSMLKMNGSGVLRGMAWSADGNWLLTDLSWDVAGEPYAKALVQADTCRIIPLPDLEGRVIGWLP